MFVVSMEMAHLNYLTSKINNYNNPKQNVFVAFLLSLCRAILYNVNFFIDKTWIFVTWKALGDMFILNRNIYLLKLKLSVHLRIVVTVNNNGIRFNYSSDAVFLWNETIDAN